MVKSSCEFEVQGHELDTFSHVNNAVYLNYLEIARWKFFRNTGLLESMMAQEIYPVVVETNIKYMRELKIFDYCTINTEWFINGEFIIAKHVICKNDNRKSKCVKASVKMLLVSKERIAQSVPQKLKDIINEETKSSFDE